MTRVEQNLETCEGETGFKTTVLPRIGKVKCTTSGVHVAHVCTLILYLENVWIPRAELERLRRSPNGKSAMPSLHVWALNVRLLLYSNQR
jgi:hypothetical protein